MEEFENGSIMKWRLRACRITRKIWNRNKSVLACVDRVESSVRWERWEQLQICRVPSQDIQRLEDCSGLQLVRAVSRGLLIEDQAKASARRMHDQGVKDSKPTDVSVASCYSILALNNGEGCTRTKSRQMILGLSWYVPWFGAVPT